MTEYEEVTLHDGGPIGAAADDDGGDAIISEDKSFVKLLPGAAISRSHFSVHRNKFLRSISFSNAKSQSSQKIRKYDLLSRDNLNIPIRRQSGRYFKEIDTREPLIGLTSHSDSEDCYEGGPAFSVLPNSELRTQLIKDGYNLDQLQSSDCDELDLIPPRSFRQSRCQCSCCWCNHSLPACVII